MITQIRRATEQDAKTIAFLNADVHQLHADALPHWFKQPSNETFPEAKVQALLAKPENFFFIASEADQAVGYLFAEVVERPEDGMRHARDWVYIHQISIKPAYQQHGHGERLIAAAKALAQERGIPTVALDVWAFNDKARSFFERQGFTVFNYRMWMEAGQ
ncbi:MAG: N-acetyltransferase [Caldilineaceae bacterium]